MTKTLVIKYLFWTLTVFIQTTCPITSPLPPTECKKTTNNDLFVYPDFTICVLHNVEKTNTRK
jgi:hypothetical protein